METKSFNLEFKDLNTGKREAVIAHAVYTNIDRAKDICTKGMFTKSWQENPKPDFLFNHNEEDVVGPTVRTFEDNERAYTQVKFGNWTLGNDVLEMADAGVLKGASFKYETVQREFKSINGQRIRVLKEAKHLETSLLTILPCNPEAGIVELNKSFESLDIKSLSQNEQSVLKQILSLDQQALEKLVALNGSVDVSSDLYTWVTWNISRRADAMGSIMSQLRYNAQELNAMKAHADTLQKFLRNGKASDATMRTVEDSLEETKSIIATYDTASTPLITEPEASKKGDSFYKQLLLLNAKLS